MNGNVSTCNATVTVRDVIDPVAQCKDTTIYLDASGSITIDSSYVDNGSTDECGIASIVLNKSVFTCADIGTPQVVTVTAIDNSGNSDICTSTITVLDTVAPTVVCTDTTVYLSAAGTVTIDTTFIDNGSADACGIASRSISATSFTCADTGSNVVTLTVVDIYGNTSSCTATVTVLDTVAPTAVCRDTTVYLDAVGTVSIDSTYIENGRSGEIL